MRVLVDNAKRIEYKRQWLKNNPHKSKAYSAKWIAANKQKRREIEKDWRARNPEKVAAMNARAGRKWTNQNRGRRNAITAARRAAIRLRTLKWVNRDDIVPFYERAAQLSIETGIPHEVDHIIPLLGVNVCGLHVSWNLRVIPRKDNRSKGIKCAA